MRIEDFIARTYVVRIQDEKKRSIIDRVIDQTFHEHGIHVKRLQTNAVFPRVIELMDGDRTILWDESYWEIYEDFFYAIINYCTLKEDPSLHLGDDEHLENKIIAPFLKFLALVTRDNSLSVCFAQRYQAIQNRKNQIYSAMSFEKTYAYLEVAKLYVATHELMHIDFSGRKESKDSGIKQMIELLEIAQKIINGYSNEYCLRYYLNSKESLLSWVEYAIQEPKTREELLCDTYALNNCLYVFRHIWKDLFSDSEIINICMESINIWAVFNSSLIATQILWETNSPDVGNLSKTKELLAHRAYLSELIACVQLYQQGIDDINFQDSFFKVIDGTNVLPNLLYRHFESDEAITFWKSESSLIQKKDEYEKYNYIGWRV